MPANKMADVLDRLGDAIADAANALRDGHDDNYNDNDGFGHEVEAADEQPVQAANDPNPVFEATMLQVPAGDLWRLVNRARKSIRLAREGKIPDMDARAPLRDAIRALKAQGLVKKPKDLRK